MMPIFAGTSQVKKLTSTDLVWMCSLETRNLMVLPWMKTVTKMMNSVVVRKISLNAVLSSRMVTNEKPTAPLKPP